MFSAILQTDGHRYSLAYAGMPLVLAAIDLKLSSTREDIAARQKRLNCLSRIIRHSETLFDVTDFVAAGTNRLLQLAYKTTQNFFLSGSNSPIPSGNPMLVGGNDLAITPNRARHPKMPSPSRAKSWLDAFIRYPRAYLFISTSVDHCLSVGRMPYGNALPALVRDIPAMGSMTQIPRKIDPYVPSEKVATHWSNPSLYHIKNYRSGSVESGSTIQTVTTDETDDRITRGADHLSFGPNPVFQPSWDGNFRVDTSVCKVGGSLVNLDFLDLENNPAQHHDFTQAQAPASNYNYLNNFTMGPMPNDPQSSQLNEPMNFEEYMDENIAAGFDMMLYNSLFQDAMGDPRRPMVGQ